MLYSSSSRFEACKCRESIYVSYMPSIVYPLNLPEDLYGEVKQTANETRLSIADAMRQGLKLGLPALREKLGAERVTNVQPLPKKTLDRLYRERDEDSESIRQFIAAQPKSAQ